VTRTIAPRSAGAVRRGRLTDVERAEREIREEPFMVQVTGLAEVLGWSWMHVRPGVRANGRWWTPTTGPLAKWPDLVLVRERDRRLVFAELKREIEQPTPEQQAVLDVLGSLAAWQETDYAFPPDPRRGACVATVRPARPDPDEPDLRGAPMTDHTPEAPNRPEPPESSVLDPMEAAMTAFLAAGGTPEVTVADGVATIGFPGLSPEPTRQPIPDVVAPAVVRQVDEGGRFTSDPRLAEELLDAVEEALGERALPITVQRRLAAAYNALVDEASDSMERTVAEAKAEASRRRPGLIEASGGEIERYLAMEADAIAEQDRLRRYDEEDRESQYRGCDYET
jgi:hypothetical protein